ncbi:MAG: n-acetylglutamate synthase, partial [Sphingobacteriales bacterium]
MMNYNNKKFKAVNNSVNGETSADTIFHYQQDGTIISAHYAGGKIIKGHLLGLMAENGSLNFRYHQVNDKGEIMTGACTSTPEIMPGGKIRLHENWEWTSGDFSKGASVIEEI